MDSLECQTVTATPAEPGDLPCWFSGERPAREFSSVLLRIVLAKSREKQVVNYFLRMITFKETVGGFSHLLPQLRALN